MSDPRPMSAMQQAMLVQEAVAGCPLYTMPLCFTVRGPVDADALEAALRHVLERHPVLLSSYDGEFARPCPGGFTGLRRVTDPALGDASALTELWDTLFELATEAPVRATLVSGGPDEHVLGLAVHHVAGDSWSLAILLRELGVSYGAVRAGTRPVLAAAPDFFDHAAWERRQVWDDTWWRDRLRGAPARPARRAEPPPEAERGRLTAVDLDLDADDTRAVRAMSRAERLSPAAVLFTAVSAAVAGDRGESVVGLPTALRDTAPLQETVGPLINTLPVRTVWPPGLRGADLLAVHAASMEDTVAHKEVPYPRILRAAGTPRGLGADPLLEHVVNVDSPLPDLPLPGLRTAVRPVARRRANLPALWQFTWGTVGNIHGALEAETATFSPQDAHELADRFRRALRHLVREPR